MMVLDQKKAVLLVYVGNGSVWGGICWYLVVLGQYRAIQFDMMLPGQYEAELVDS